MRNIVVINGPNLNLLGTREPEVYGYDTLADLESKVIGWGTDHGLSVETYQSNHEGDLIDRIQQAAQYADGVILNAGALTHYSYALHDAIAGVPIPTIEVHISNIYARDEWRRHSVLAPACAYSIVGRGLRGYNDALAHLRWTNAMDFETIAYGQADDQIADLRIPAGDGPFPVAVLVHGDLWLETMKRDLMDGIAVDLARRGWATWNLEFHRERSAEGWRHTLNDIAAGLDALADLSEDRPLDLSRLVAIGHSSGGQLALWAGRGNREGEPVAGPTRVALRAVVALAPLVDLAEAHRRHTGDGAVSLFLGGGIADRPDRYEAASPAALLPLGIPQIIVHPGGDDVVDPDMTAGYVDAARDEGDDVAYFEPPEASRHSILDPESPGWLGVLPELETLAGSGVAG